MRRRRARPRSPGWWPAWMRPTPSSGRRPWSAVPAAGSGSGSAPTRAPSACRRARGPPPRPPVERLSWYGDPENHDLRADLAAHHGVDVDQVLVAAGIDDLLALVVRAFATDGGRAVMALGSYPTFAYHTATFGVPLDTAPYGADDHVDLAALAARARASEAVRARAAGAVRRHRGVPGEPGQPFRHLAGRGRGAGFRRRAARPLHPGAGRGLHRLCADRPGALPAHGRSPGSDPAHLLQGAWHGGGAHRIRGGRGRGVHRAEQAAPAVRGEPGGPGGGTGLADGCRVRGRGGPRGRRRPRRVPRAGTRAGTADPAVGNQLRVLRSRHPGARRSGDGGPHRTRRVRAQAGGAAARPLYPPERGNRGGAPPRGGGAAPGGEEVPA